MLSTIKEWAYFEHGPADGQRYSVPCGRTKVGIPFWVNRDEWEPWVPIKFSIAKYHKTPRNSGPKGKFARIYTWIE